MEFRKNDCLTVTIEDMGSDGEGIGKAEGFTLFVKDAVLGDTVEAKIVKVKKNYAYARLEKVLTPSPFRVEPKCLYHRQCGGCQLQALSYKEQLCFKQEKIRGSLIRIGGLAPELVDSCMEPLIGMEEPLHYRNKAQYPVGTDRDGSVITGFYAGRTHTIIPNTDCCLGAAENKEILELILAYMRENHVTAYEETTGRGLIRHVLIRKGFASGEIMVCLVINLRKDGAGRERNPGIDSRKNSTPCDGGKRHEGLFRHGPEGKRYLPNQEELINRLKQVRGMTCISVSVNNENTNVIMGREIHTLWGSDTIQDTIHVRDMTKPGYPFTGRELTFRISPLSFYQVNPVQTEKLYSLALEYAGLTGQETVWDLYCGIGTISLIMAGNAKKVYGVEVIPQAIEDARQNAAGNGIKNAEFFVGNAEKVLPAFYQEQKLVSGGDVPKEDGDSAFQMLHPDVIVVDPPRKGCDEACLETMLKMRPDRIVYVSCDPATLARDIKFLRQGGYELRRVRGVDQFGMTVHVETVCLLSKLNTTQHIEIDLSVDELDLTNTEKKATYQEIKDYVLEHSGLKVSSLYIAQIKQKCGIIERENYNRPKTEDVKQPQCPPNKEKAIKEALKHFGMLSVNTLCYCGHDCAKCVTYIATKNNDDFLREQSKKFYKEKLGIDIPLNQFNCAGGRSGNVFELCKGCPFVKCCKDHEVNACCECPDYPCKDIAEYQAGYVNKCNQL